MPGRYTLRIIALGWIFIWINVTYAQTGDVTPQQFQTPNCNFQIEAFVQHPSCTGDSDGRIELVEQPGPIPVTVASYNWYTVFAQPTDQPIVDNLPAGIYPCQLIGQNGCVDTIFVELIEPDPIAPIRNNAILCSGQQNVNLLNAISGGTPPYSYSYSSTIGLSCINCPSSEVNLGQTATFTLQITDSNGCTAMEDVFITVLDPIALNITTEPETCGGDGNIEINATGGGSNYTYSVDGQPFVGTNISGGLAAGTHTVVVQDNQGCTASQTVNVPTAQLAVDFSTSVTDVGCFGEANGTVSVIDNEGTITGFSLEDNDFFNPAGVFSDLTAGDYTMYVQDANGCVTSQPFTVDEPDELVFASTVGDVTCPTGLDGSITVQAAGGTAGYEYSINQGPFQASNSFQALSAGIYEIGVKDANNCVTFNTYAVNEPAEPLVQVDKEDASCPGEMDASIVVIVSGGGLNDSYLYSIDGNSYQQSNEFLGLNAGIYTAYIQNQNGCITTENFTIDEPPTPSLGLTTGGVTCPGGNDASIVVIVSGGGVTQYGYSLDGIVYQPDNTFENLGADIYQVFVQDPTGCVFTENIIVDEPAEPVVQVNKQAPSCPGENDAGIVVIVSGGGVNDSYQYSIDGATYQASNSFSGLGSGIYTVFIQNQNGCTTTQNFTIIDPPSPTIDLISEDVTCPNGNDASIVVIVSGGGVYEYSLDGIVYQPSNTFDNLSEGTYQVFIQDQGGCVFSSSALVMEPAEPVVDVDKEDVSCPGADDASISINVTGSEAGDVFQYSLDGTNYQSSADFVNLPAGAYTAFAQNQNGCISSQTFTIIEPVTPNINFITEDVTCNSGSDASIVVIVSGGGAVDNEYSLDGIVYQPDSVFTGLPAGAYQAFVQDPNGCVFTENIILDEPAEPVIQVNKSDVTCPGGSDASIVVIVSGGGLGDTYEYSLDGAVFQSDNEFIGLSEGGYTVFIQNQNGCVSTELFTIDEPNVPNIQLIENNVTCPGGNNAAIVVIVSGGGVTQYQYSLDGQTYQTDNTFQNLSANNYQVFVQNPDGCVFTENAIITEPDQPTININVSGSTCSGGNDASIVVIVSGGGLGDTYEYSLDGNSYQADNSFAGLTMGSYTAFIQNQNGCISTEDFIIQQTQAPNVSYNIQDVTCPGGNDASIVVIVSGGGATNYEYSLDAITFQPSNTFNGLSSGAYTGYVRDNFGCVTSEPFAITEPQAPNVNVNVTNNECPGDNNASIVVIVSGGGLGDTYLYSLDGNNYQADNNFINLSEGVYTAYAQNQNGCIETEIFTIDDPSIPNISFNITEPTCPEGIDASIVVVVSGGGAAPFEYALNGGSFQASNSFTGLNAGIYIISVKDANDCLYAGIAVITDPLEASLTISTQEPTCAGGADGSATLTISGGVPGDSYTYSLDGSTYQVSNSFGDLAAGSYIGYALNQNGCVTTENFSVTNPVEPDIQLVIDDVSCPGAATGQIIVIVTNGNVSDFEYSLNGTEYISNNIFAGLSGGVYTIYVRDLNNCVAIESAFVNENSSPSISVSTSDPDCYAGADGMATIIAVGGSGGFEYSLDGIIYSPGNEFDDLTAGIYEAYVRDIYSCVFTQFFQITDPVSPDITHNKTDITCYDGDDGIIEINVTGGTPPYEYSLDGSSYYGSNTFSGLIAGSYTTHIRDANNCSYSEFVTLDEPDGWSVSFTTQNASCGFSNGVAACTASGSTPPYAYNWDNGQIGSVATGLSSGFHYLTITDLNFCSWSDSVFVADDGGPTADPLVVDVSCFGAADGAIDLTMTGGTAPYTYSWSLGMTTEDIFGLQAGNYKVVIIDANNCVSLLEYVVNEPTDIELNADISDANGIATIDLSVTGGTEPYEYLWSTGETIEDPTNLISGFYAVTVTDYHGCTKTDLYEVVLTDVDPPRPDISVSVFPNPTDDFIEVQFDLPGTGDVIIDLYSVVGQEIYKDIKVPVVDGHYKMDISHLAAAVYLLKFEWQDKIIVKKILKQLD